MTDVRGIILEAARLMSRDKLVQGTWGNISARVREGMWITPCGMEYEKMELKDLVLVAPDGSVREGSWQPSSEWRLHAAVYSARRDCMGIVHTHSVHATAFALARTPIPPVAEDLVQVVGGGVPVAEYALPGTEKLAINVVRALADGNAVLLASHGLVGAAGSVAEALKVCRIVEKTAQAALLASLLGPVAELGDDDIRAMRSFYLNNYGPRPCLEGGKQ